MEIHDAIRPLEFLLGTWVGEGEGIYPTIEPFAYTEQVTFTPGPGKPFVACAQKTWRGDTRDPQAMTTAAARSVTATRPAIEVAGNTCLITWIRPP